MEAAPVELRLGIEKVLPYFQAFQARKWETCTDPVMVDKRIRGTSLATKVSAIIQGMEYQLVIQIPQSEIKDFDDLIRIEDSLIRTLGDSALVDGHDMGSGEANIFIISKDPQSTFDTVKKILNLKTVKVGYREISEENYRPVWPLGLASFSVK